jgi:hypothetical protein
MAWREETQKIAEGSDEKIDVKVPTDHCLIIIRASDVFYWFDLGNHFNQLSQPLILDDLSKLEHKHNIQDNEKYHTIIHQDHAAETKTFKRIQLNKEIEGQY